MQLKGAMVVCLIPVLVLSCLAVAVVATPSLHLNFYKNFGYGLGNDMSGRWTINTDVSQDVTRVEFYLDGQLQLNDTSAPFSWSFDTANYTQGVHSIKAIAYNTASESATSVSERNFVESVTTEFLVIVFILGIVVLGVSLVGALFWVRKKEQQSKKPHKPSKAN